MRNITPISAYEFLKECVFFYVLTINGDYPAGRPFGAIAEIGGDLYISTNDHNEAHNQLRKNGHIQIIAKKPTGREWIRLTGTVEECNDVAIKQKIYENSPILQRHHASAASEHFLVFRVAVEKEEFK